MEKVLGFINHNISLQRQRYLSEISRRSNYFTKGNRKCESVKDNNIMLTRDIAKIDNDKINKRQQNIKVNLILIGAYYMMLIYFAIKFCAQLLKMITIQKNNSKGEITNMENVQNENKLKDDYFESIDYELCDLANRLSDDYYLIQLNNNNC